MGYNERMEKYSRDKNFVVMSRDEVRAFDAWAINELGMAGVVLMENAGRSCAELVIEKLAGAGGAKVCVFCGTGNNGGDGYVIARHLLNAGVEVAVVLCGERAKVRGDAKANFDILEGMGQRIECLDLSGDDIADEVGRAAGAADMIVDGLFGTGLSGELRDEYKVLVESINAQDVCVVAVDIPSGLDCDTGEPLGAAVEADYTVTFVAVKRGFTLGERANRYTGGIYVASIGVEPGE